MNKGYLAKTDRQPSTLQNCGSGLQIDLIRIGPRKKDRF
jgi:hypothetical protein